jgi:proline iminopeptidase
VAHFAGDVVSLGLARIEAHYFSHGIFLPENALLANLHRVRHLPCVIVQGRYDAVCPIVTADEVHRAWPESEYIVVPDSGHSAWEPGISAQLVRATERLRTKR